MEALRVLKSQIVSLEVDLSSKTRDVLPALTSRRSTCSNQWKSGKVELSPDQSGSLILLQVRIRKRSSSGRHLDSRCKAFEEHRVGRG